MSLCCDVVKEMSDDFNVDFSRVNLLGCGAYGSVYKATIDSVPCAVKRYIGTKDRWSQTAIREFVSMSTIPCHHNIMGIEFAHENETGVCLVFPRLNSSLYGYIKNELKGKVPCNLVLKWSEQILSAVSHIHEHGFIHRDVKMENVLLDIDNNAYIGDFGMARFVPRENLNPAMSREVCSLWTRPPELFSEQIAIYDDRVDSWSVGCVMLAMAAGRYVFRSMSTNSSVMPSVYAILGIGDEKKRGCYVKKTESEQIEALRSAANRTDLPIEFFEAVLKLLTVDPFIRARVKEVSKTFSDLYPQDIPIKLLKITNIPRGSILPFREDVMINSNISTKKQIANWIWDTCITLRVHQSTALLSLICWMRFTSLCPRHITEAQYAAASCSLICKINEVKCFSPSTWSKSVACKVSLIQEAESFLVKNSKGNLMIKCGESISSIAATFLFLVLTDMTVNDALVHSKRPHEYPDWELMRLNLPRVSKYI
jgi:serine/threonine protein kinase